MDKLILAIESSCDETSAAIVKNGREILSNIISSQIEIHKKYGGVVPEIASRKHIEAIDFVIDQALKEAGITLDNIDAVAVTYGPGLVGALLVGLSEAKALAFALGKPLIGVHHIEGHIAANYIQNRQWKPPFVCLVVSGGHTHLVDVKDYSSFDVIGRTRDDAAGEAFDKVARTLGLTYPGGPAIEKLARDGNANAIPFPRIMLENGCYDFSFSGLKSAVLNYVNKCNMKNETYNPADVAASFQKAVTDVLTTKCVDLCRERNIKKAALAGGVSANGFLRTEMSEACRQNGIELCIPDSVLCTDNAAMIGSAAYFELIAGRTAKLSLNAYPNLKLGDKQS